MREGTIVGITKAQELEGPLCATPLVSLPYCPQIVELMEDEPCELIN